ncbi:TPA: hypothetical protein ACH3X2_013834 [Trebouxia sp. C0005]
MPELRIALLNIAFTQNPALKATLRRALSTESIPKLSGDQDFPPTISTACSTSPSTPVTRSPQAFLDEKPAQQESTEQQSPSRSPPNEQEFKQLKQQLDSHDRRIKRHEKILEERKRQDRQCALVLYGLKELDVQPPQDWKSKDDSLIQLLKASLPKVPGVGYEWNSNKRLGSFSSNNRKPRPVLIEFPSMEDKHQFLQLSKPLRESGLRLDDWLTEQQQKERDALNADFQALKGKGYKPFFRGSVLMYRSNDKACVCQQDKADTVPPAL